MENLVKSWIFALFGMESGKNQQKWENTIVLNSLSIFHMVHGF